MRSYSEYRQIIELHSHGYSTVEIALQTDIPRETVRDCINKYGTIEKLDAVFQFRQIERFDPSMWDSQVQSAYTYILGVYLGDGVIDKVRRTYRMRISMDGLYQNIIREVCNNIRVLLPDNSISTISIENSRGINIVSYSQNWAKLIPQHSGGFKHLRKIELDNWQNELIERYPLWLLRGLYHADGCRIEPMVNGRVYPRYQFTQVSEDIRRLFSNTCTYLGLNWTEHRYNITIARRKDVEFLDRTIGAKT